MFNRELEKGLLEVLEAEGIGCIVFSPLAQGLLTDKYLHGIPEGSRASKGKFLKPEDITAEKLGILRALNELAGRRGQTLAQMAVAWVLRHPQVTSVLIGASRPAHIDDAVTALNNATFSAEELKSIDAILGA
jgi:L-glyceraldehyde 3-phosphate reductase